MRRVLTAATFGGVILFAAAASAQTPANAPTFSKDIAPIFQAKCQECHQPNSIAPMSLITFAEARPWARSIKSRVSQRQMPPWHIDPSVGVQKFKNDMSLSQKQIDTIVAWVDAGAPQGDPKDLPPAKPISADNEWKGVQGRLRQARPRHPQLRIQDAGEGPGRVVPADERAPDHRAALGEDGRDSSRPTSRRAASCITQSRITC
jgi:mono/diheme cytochrome c family protein